MLWGVDACMAATALFMLGYGIQLCIVTQYSTMAEFPELSQAIVYLPIPVAGLLTLLFLIERVWVGEPPKTSIMYRDQADGARIAMDVLVLLGSFTLLCALAVPVAYALGSRRAARRPVGPTSRSKR